MKKILLPLSLAVLMLLAYLLLWPVPIEPQAWTPPPAPALSGVYAANDQLKALQPFGVGTGIGPEGITLDTQGRVYAGYVDGRVVRYSADLARHEELGQTQGRPLGLAVTPSGDVVVADAYKGLLRIAAGQPPQSLSTAAAGRPLMLTDDAAVASDGRIYFSDASKHPLHEVLLDFIEHSGSGRLLRYDPATGQTEVLLQRLQFGNGVTLGPDEAYVLVNETAEYRVRRYWLKGDKAGTSDLFISNLPGLPDNISYNPQTHRFWLALFAPRNAALDQMAPGPAWIKKLAARLPAAVQPKPAHKAWVLGLDEQGKVIANLQYDSPAAYGPITSVREFGPWLYFGSLTADSLARLPLPKDLPSDLPGGS